MKTTLSTVLCAILLASLPASGAENPDAARLKMLVAAANDPDENLRQAALRALGRLRSEAAIPALLDLMQDPSESVRALAASALAEMASPKCFDAFVSATRDPSRSVQMSAVRALAKLKDPRAIPALASAMNDANSDVAGGAADALAAMGDPAVDALAKALEGTPGTRYRAASALAKIGTPRAMATLQAAAEHTDWFVRHQAVRAAGQAKVAPMALLAKAAKDSNAAVRLAAAQALAQRRDQGDGARAALMGLLGDRHTQTRHIAAQALRNASDRRLPALFAPLLTDPNPDIRRAAADNIIRSDNPDALAALATRTADPYDSVRRLAVAAIAKLPPERAVPGLTAVALGSDSGAASLAIRALGEVPDNGGVEALGKVVRSGQPDGRRYAARVLAETGGPQAVRHLQAAWPTADASLKREMLGALTDSRLESAIGLLATAIKDSDVSIRIRGVQRMGRLRDSEQAATHLISVVGSKDSTVRQVAMALLAVNTSDKASAALLKAAGRGALLEKNWNRAYLLPVVARLARDGDKKAFEPLAAALAKQTDASTRRAYLLALGVSANPKALAPLTAALKDPDASIRSAAAAALGYLGDTKAIDALKELAAAKDPAAPHAIAAWARLDAKGAFAAFTRLLQAQPVRTSTRIRFLEAIQAAKDHDLTAAFLAGVANPDRAVSQRSGLWLVAAGDARTLPGLRRIAEDKQAHSYAVSMARQTLQRIRQYKESLETPRLPLP